MKIFYSLLFALLLAAGCSQQEQAASSEFYLFVGTYTDQASEGIYLYRFDAHTGNTDSLGLAAKTDNPSYLASSPNDSMIYAVNELSDSTEAAVSAFSFNREEETLKILNSQSSHGGAPCYVSVDNEGQAVFAGNYVGGSLAMFPVNDDGSLNEAIVTIQHEGSSVNENRQRSSHVHCTYVSPDNNYLFVTDLGTDRVISYPFSHLEPKLGREAATVFNTEPGAGPRHLTFHPNGRYAYLINELNGSIVVFNHQEGVLNPVQTISNIPSGYDGKISGADIHLSPDGEFLYASNREDLNTIVIYDVDQNNGRLTKVGEEISGGAHPRNFVIDPTGNYLLVANRHTNNIVIFERNQDTGMLASTGEEIKISQPVCLIMIPV